MKNENIDKALYGDKESIAFHLNKATQEIAVLRSMIGELESKQKFLEQIRTSCRECESWENNGCIKAGGVAPPPNVIENGCREWRWDGVPF